MFSSSSSVRGRSVRGRRWAGRAAITLLTACGIATAPQHASAATAGAPLRLTSVTSELATASTGQRVGLQAAGSGLRTAGRTRVTFYLSADDRLDADDLRLGAATTKALRRKRAFTVKLAAKIPSRAGLRAWRVLACVAYRADGRARCSCRPAATPLATRRAPRPLTARPVLEPGGAVTRQVGPAGGTLRTTGADGSSLTLTIPAGALGEPETVTMTPVGAVDGLRRSGLSAGGAAFEPEGLLLGRPATLRVVPKTGVAEDQVTGYAFQGPGKEFHFKPAVADGAAIEVEVPHFSGVGTARASTAVRAAVTGSSAPTAPADQAEQEMAVSEADFEYDYRLQVESAAKGAVGSGNDVVQDLYDLAAAVTAWSQWRKATLEEAAALQASGAVPRARSIAAHWIARSWELLRWNYPQRIALAGLQCTDAHRLEAATALRHITDVTRAMPDPPDGTFTNEAARADAIILACLQFDVEVFTQLRASAGDDVRMEVDVSFPFKLTTIRRPTFTGQATPTVRSYTVNAPSCWTHPPASFQPGLIGAEKLELQGLQGRPRTFFYGNEIDKGRIWGFTLDLGTIKETVTHEAKCEGMETFTNEMNIYNAGVAAIAKGSGAATLRNGVGLPATPATKLFVNDLQRLDEDTWFRQINTSSDQRVSGKVDIRLTHRPKG